MMLDIKSFTEDLLLKMSEDTAILEIYEVGSQLFRENPSDLDFVVLCKNFSQKFIMKKISFEGLSYDITIMDKYALISQLDFNSRHFVPYNLKLSNYKYAINKTIYGKSFINWNMLEHQEDYVNYLIDHYNVYTGMKAGRPAVESGKLYVHYYIVLKIYENKKNDERSIAKVVR